MTVMPRHAKVFWRRMNQKERVISHNTWLSYQDTPRYSGDVSTRTSTQYPPSQIFRSSRIFSQRLSLSSKKQFVCISLDTEYCLFYRALLQKRPIILRSLLIVATPYPSIEGAWGQILDQKNCPKFPGEICRRWAILKGAMLWLHCVHAV